MRTRVGRRGFTAWLATAAVAAACSSDGPSADNGATGGAPGTASGGASGAGSGGTSGGAPSGGATSTSGATAGGGSAGSSGVGGAMASGGTPSRGVPAGNGGTSAVTGGAGSSTGGASNPGCAGTTDACPMSNGIEHACKKRFALGINYAWHHFSADFGGVGTWGLKSVSQDAPTFDAELAAMREGGASVIRWWIFPDFRGDGVTFDANGDPSGLSAVARADVAKALELARKNDVHLVLTVFSFDGFRPDRTESGRNVRGLTPMVTNAMRRKKVVENVVRPLARAVASSPDRSHLLGWDVINEPEWAIAPAGNAPGGQDFTPNDELAPVSLANMKAFITESLAALRAETPDAQTSVGTAAAKWAWAFEDLDVDFDQPHIYGWVNQYWPYTRSPAELGYGKRPIVMGEFFLQSMPFSDSGNNATFAQILESWWGDGYSGAWAWHHNETPGSTLIRDFKAAKGCPAGF